jgi:predicted ATPase/DNA-binding SARP family transcriptional activator
VQFRDLGPLQVEVDGAPRPLGGLKPVTVLSVLLVHVNRRVSVDALVDALWGSAASHRAADTLESHVWRLRRMLEPDRDRGAAWTVVLNDSGGYRLVAAPQDVDSLRFQAMATSIRELAAQDRPDQVLDQCTRALALWRGRPYELFADHEWAVPLVARLDELLLEVQERRVDALLALGDDDGALSEVAGLIEESPFRERLWAQRMLALYRTGRNEEALSSYQRARTLLLDELGLEPGPQLRDLQNRILAQDGELGAPPVTARAPRPAAPARAPVEPAPEQHRSAEVRLPARGGRLIGRSVELARLVTLTRANRLVTLTGAAGCGKTRLSVEVAAGLVDAFPDGVWFVDLASVADPALVADVVISTIGFTTGDQRGGLQVLQDYLRDRQALLVLDNCEHLLEAAAALVEAVLTSGSPSSVLATSREPLGVAGEVLWSLSPLALTRDATAPEPTSRPPGGELAPAVELFVERVSGANPSLTFDAEDLAVVERICAAVDGLPLALELAAARIRSATLSEIAEQVTSDVGGLRRLGRGSDDHRASVRAGIEWSYRLLGEQEQAVHRRLSVLPGAFPRAAAAAVAGVAPVSPAEVPDLLALLVHRSLLDPAPARPGGATLYRQLATVRSHAASHLDAQAEAAAAHQRRDGWVQGFLDQRPRLSRAAESWYERADDAFPTLRATLHRRLVEQRDPAAGSLLTRLAMFWYHRQRMVEARRWLELALELPDLAPRHAGTTHLVLVAHGLMGGRPDIVAPHLTAALPRLAELAGDELVEAGELLAAVALAAEAQQAHPVFARVVSAVGDAAERSGDGTLALLRTGLDALARTAAGDGPGVDAEVLFQRAATDGNVLAGWVAATIGAATAPEPTSAIRWTDRQARSQLLLGAVDGGVFAERRATYMLAAGQVPEAVRLLAAARSYNRRAGLPWPLLPFTEDSLDRARRELGDPGFDELWQDGARQHVTALMPAP